jgi:hypothetical protein
MIQTIHCRATIFRRRPVLRSAQSLAPHSHIYTNWVKAVYESTPYSIEAIPNPSKIAEAIRARSAAFVGS